MCRKSGSAHADNAGFLHLTNNFFPGEGGYIFHRGIFYFRKLIIALDHNGIDHVPHCNAPWFNLGNRSGYGRIDWRRYKATGFCNLLTL